MKTTRRLLCALLSVMLVLTVSFALFACSDDAPTCTEHQDKNDDLLCDVCSASLPCTSHFDANGDSRCDRCLRPLPCTNHVDQNFDSACDKCGAYVEPSCTSHVDSNGDLKCDNCYADVPCTVHVDSNGDDECDKCGTEIEREVKKLLLIEGMESNFQFVIAGGCGSDVRSAVEREVVKVLKDDYDIEIPIVFEGYSNDEEMDIEVLIGDVENRGDQYKYNKYSLGEKGYIIKIVEEKVIINAGSEKSLIDAIIEFAEDILGLGEDEIFDVTMTSDDDVIEIQDNYKISSLSVNGQDMKGYTIAVDKLNKRYHDTAKNIQSVIYSRTGYRFEIVSLDEATDKSIIINHIDKVYSDESYAIYTNGGKLIIECAFDNMLEKATTSFLTSTISDGSGDVNFKGKVYNQDISVVYYSEFGAEGDGKTDDYQAIFDTHVFANECGQTVKADKNAVYYLHYSYVVYNAKGARDLREIPIKTNTDWSGAEFIIDDSDIHDHIDASPDLPTSGMPELSIFSIESDYAKTQMTRNSHPEILAALGSVGYSYGTTHIDLGLGYPALLIIYDQDHAIYRRYGDDYANANGGKGQYAAQQELIVVDENGRISDETPFMFDYKQITKIEIIRTDVEPITVSGGLMTTRACHLDASYVNSAGNTKTFGYYVRGINVNRSHTVVEGVKHHIEGEITIEEQMGGLDGAHYRGFFYATEADGVTFKDCVLQGRRYYGLSGTYDFSAKLVNNIFLIDCVQRNFWIDANGNPSATDTGRVSMERVDTIVNGTAKSINYCWGIGGTNFCKNMEYIGCKLSRFDAHQGLYNGRVENTDLQAYEIIGKGDFIIKNVNWYTYGTSGNNVVALRSDYGSTWEGTIYIDGFNLYVVDGECRLVSHSYRNWFFGYTCYVPNIEIKGLSIYSKATRLPVKEGYEVMLYTNFSEPYMHLDETQSTNPKIISWSESLGKYVFGSDPTRPLANDNKTVPPSYVKVIDNPNNYVYTVKRTDDPNYFLANTKFYYPNTDHYLVGTNNNNEGPYVFK